MAQRPSSWKAQKENWSPPSDSGGGGSVVRVRETYTPSAGTPSDIAPGAILDAGMLGDGNWKIVDPYTAFNGIVDDGASMRVNFDLGVGSPRATTQTMYGNALLSQPMIVFKDAVFGDFEFTARFKNPVNTSSYLCQLAIFAGTGDTTNQCQFIGQQHGRWQTSNAKFFGWCPADSGYGTLYTGSLVSRTELHWAGIKRVKDTIYFGEGGTDAEPNWTWTAKKWDVAGGAPTLGIMFMSGAAPDEDYDFYEIRIDCFKYVADPSA